MLIDGRTSFGAVAEYTCDADYLIRPADAASATRKCESNGRWSRNEIACDIIECPVPRAPAGGRVSGYDRTIRAEIEFSCLTGHVLLGAETLSCAKDGRWSGPIPSCKFVDCGQLPKIEGGAVRDGEIEIGEAHFVHVV